MRFSSPGNLAEVSELLNAIRRKNAAEPAAVARLQELFRPGLTFLLRRRIEHEADLEVAVDRILDEWITDVRTAPAAIRVEDLPKMLQRRVAALPIQPMLHRRRTVPELETAVLQAMNSLTRAEIDALRRFYCGEESESYVSNRLNMSVEEFRSFRHRLRARVRAGGEAVGVKTAVA